MTLCISIDTLSMTYLDDELADEELREFELHLLDCASCRGRVEAERESLAELRRKLAPPPTPDIVRARLRAALDAEDAVTAGQRSWTQWILPGTASIAAVAALAVFVLMREPAEKPPSADAVVSSQQLRRPSSMQPVVGGRPAEAIVIQRDATANEVVQNRRFVKIWYTVTLPDARQFTVMASVFSARDFDLRLGQHVMVNGFDLWGTTQNGPAQVFYEGPTGTGYGFVAPELGLRDLEYLVANSLLDDVGAR